MKAAVRTNFDDSVSAYDAYEQRTGRFTALAKLLAAELSARADSPVNAVLDAGAGTGVSTRVFAERAQRTVALDISREMLRELKAAPRIEADFDHLPFVDNSFDGVAFTASLFLVPDPAVAARGLPASCVRTGSSVPSRRLVGSMPTERTSSRTSSRSRGRQRGQMRSRRRSPTSLPSPRVPGALRRRPKTFGVSTRFQRWRRVSIRNSPSTSASRRHVRCSQASKAPSNSGGDGSSASRSRSSPIIHTRSLFALALMATCPIHS